MEKHALTLETGISANLTSGEMLSHPKGWDKPIPKVIHLWRHRTSTPNNLEKSRLVCVLGIFYQGIKKKNLHSTLDFTHFWTRMRKIINHHIEGGTLESHPRVQDLLHPRLGKPRRGLQILDTWMGFPRPSLDVVLDSISLSYPNPMLMLIVLSALNHVAPSLWLTTNV